MASASPTMLEHILLVAQAAAREAGRLIRDNCGKTDVEKTKATEQDLVTVVDKACQDVIERAVTVAFPDHAILGEESVAAGSAASAEAIAAVFNHPWLWVVDPLDGTTMFVAGIPLSSVSIAVAHEGQVVVAVVYEPYRDEMYTAIRGRGAKLNGSPIAVSRETEMRKALFSFGTHTTARVGALQILYEAPPLPPPLQVRNPMLRGIAVVADISRGVRSLGSAALHMAYVAAGRFTGFWELDLSSWDIAAGALLVEEAGGSVSDMRGKPYTLLVRDILATNGVSSIHQGLIDAITRADALYVDPER